MTVQEEIRRLRTITTPEGLEIHLEIAPAGSRMAALALDLLFNLLVLIFFWVLFYFMASGFGGNILTFVCGHAPLELTAILLAGAAGLKMGYSLVETHGRTRLGSLRAQGRELLNLVLGTAAMLLVAAAVEAFWSPSSVSPQTKWVFSACLSCLLLLYFLLAGRAPRMTRREARER